jgi:alkylation response protein AidB-like acyl-CoA dehydrogenase
MAMLELDDRLRALRDQAREWGVQLRPYALDLERDPDLVRQHLDLPAVRCVARMLIPPELQDDPLRIGRHTYHGTRAMERVVAAEEIAAGDPGMFLAAPGASLSGVLVGMLGDEAQRAWYFGQVRDRPTWTFFALTEPSHGSDAGAMSTTLRPDGDGGYVLHGEKRYIGNAARAQVGTVFARTGAGPLGVAAVLVDTSAPGFHAHVLPTIGLRAAQLAAIRLDGVRIPAERVLGRHLRASAAGMWAAVRTFNLLRPGVAAIALGIARAAFEYAGAHRAALSRSHGEELDRINWQLHGARLLIWRAASAVDRDPRAGHLASAAKARAAQLAEETTLRVLRMFGPGARFEHPMLDKLARDARGVEFMEGTREIQRLGVCQALIGGRFGDD